MRILGVVAVGVGVLLMWEAWESHRTGVTPAPIAHAQAALSGTTTAGYQSDTSTAATVVA